MSAFVSNVVMLRLLFATVEALRGSVANHQASQQDGLSLAENVGINLDQYRDLMTSAVSGNSSFLVFPEFGLAPGGTKDRTLLSQSAEKIGTPSGNPCLDYTLDEQQSKPILYKMSCAARELQLPVLVNMIDYIECSGANDDKCPSDGFYLYNTDVGISSQGGFEVKYHKSHEYMGLTPQFNVPAQSEPVTWNLDGIVYGIMTCYDIFFKQPAHTYLDDGVTHFMYPVQMGVIGDDTEIKHFSKKNKITLFAANTCLSDDKEPGCSAVYVDGKKQEAERMPSKSNGDSVFIVEL